MNGINKCILIGNLGKDVELKTLPSGTQKATFSLATNESWKDNSGSKQATTMWHNVIAWGQTAELCAKYLHKGSRVYVEGKISYREYVDSTNVKRNVTEIIVNNIEFLDPAPSKQNSISSNNNVTSSIPTDEAVVDEMFAD